MSEHKSNPVFVVGFFRSGTSLLYSLLNRHSQVALMYECNALDFPATFSRARFRGNWLERQDFFNQALARHRWLLDGRDGRGDALKAPEDLYRAAAQRKKAVIWGEKSPVYGTRLLELARRYPTATFILMWRDPVEIHRSVTHAGRASRFFARPGMLDRLVYCQEQMIRQAAELHRAGARLHHVIYDDLIDRTEDVCRNICRFLGIEYEAEMLDLAHADFSPVFHEAHHAHLRRGVIERRRFAEPLLELRTVRKLERFRSRWNRLLAPLTGGQPQPSNEVEPGAAERLVHYFAGSALYSAHNLKRTIFEFLPLAWLRVYRQVKKWMLDGTPEAPSDHLPLGEQFARHWITILAGWGMLLGVATIQFFANPRMVFIPMYLLPCAVLTLVVNARWGTMAAIAAAVTGPVLQGWADPDFAHYGVLLWNSLMRFILLEVVILLLDRIRVELSVSRHSESRQGL
jgi:hypothetical protein